ncbi:MAG: DUF3987 domain-containing protein, partial [Chloroflexales bacterium]
ALGLRMGDGLETIDVDTKAWVATDDPCDLYREYESLVESQAPDLLARLVIAKTRSGGRHYIYRCAEVSGNLKLATRPRTAKELAAKPRETKPVALIETRGTGGQIQIAPSHGYTLLQGDYDALPVLTPDERSMLFQCAKLFHVATPTEPHTSRPSTNSSSAGATDEKPGECYNRTDGPTEALAMLERDGWSVRSSRGQTTYLTRPGGTKGHVHATLGHCGPGVFYPYTSGCDPFEQEEAYTPFGIKTMLEHGGDYTACAAALATRYGMSQGIRLKPVQKGQEAPDEDPAARRELLATITATSSFCELPSAVQFAPEVGADASPWLDAYIEHSRRWSPRAYDGFHVTVGLWLLSTVAARRVSLDLGGLRFTNLYLTLCARTSLYAKSTTTKIGQQVLADAGLAFMLAPDDSTPQAFIRGMSLRLTTEYAELSPEQRAEEHARLAFAANRGWYYQEFGQKLSAMMRENGAMADYRGHLRRFDDCPAEYRYETISRGTDRIERPYLSLLADFTPDDLAPHARRGSALWGDGFLARFALVAPPPHVRASTARFPHGERITPPGLAHALRDWHGRLGIPVVTVTERTSPDATKGKPTYDLSVTHAQGQRCTMAPEVYEAFYTYHDVLIELAGASELHDLDGHYARNAEKALRVAMLLASLENRGRIELRHWARAQEIAEGWRYELHCLVDGLASSSATNSREQEREEKVIRVLQRGVPMTAREVGMYAHLSSAEAHALLEHLTRIGEVNAEQIGKALRYTTAANATAATAASAARGQELAALPVSESEPAKCSKVKDPCCSATVAALAALAPPDTVSPDVRRYAEAVLAAAKLAVPTPDAAGLIWDEV